MTECLEYYVSSCIFNLRVELSARQCIKKQRHHFANKGPYNQTMVFPVVMYRYKS